jgi:type 1 fimbria pilin
MFQKITICAGLIALLSACSTTMAPVTDNHYASTDGALHIRGELVDSSNVRIYVNNAKVIEDNVSLLSGDGDFKGSFQGKPVHAKCATTSGRKLSGTTCLVAFGGERVTLTL